jgi:hypothetical protein
LRAGFEGALDECASSIATILGSGSNIVDGRKLSEMVRFYKLPKAWSHRLADEGTLEFAEPQGRGRAGTHTNQRFANLAGGINDEIRSNHHDGDDQIPPRSKFEKDGERIFNSPRNANGSKKFIRPPRSLSIPEDELREWQQAGSAPRGKNKFSVEGEKRGGAVRGRRSVAQIAGDGCSVLDLHRANFVRRGLQAVESTGKRSGENFGPRGASTKNNMLRGELNAPDFGEPGNIQHRAGQRAVAKRREDIGAAGKDGGASVCENVESILKRIRPKVQKQWLPDKAAAMRTFYFYNAPANL